MCCIAQYLGGIHGWRGGKASLVPKALDVVGRLEIARRGPERGEAALGIINRVSEAWGRTLCGLPRQCIDSSGPHINMLKYTSYVPSGH